MHYYTNKFILNAKYNYMFCMAPLLKCDSCPRHICVCISRNCITCCEKLTWFLHLMYFITHTKQPRQDFRTSDTIITCSI